MASKIFFCPNCKASLTKSPQAEILSELFGSGSSFIGLGQLSNTVTCPGCGASIDTMKMVKGEYDPPKSSGWGCLAWVAIGIVIWWFMTR